MLQGMLPLQLVAAAVAWQNCWLFTPSSSAKDPVLQASQRLRCCCSASIHISTLWLRKSSMNLVCSNERQLDSVLACQQGA